MGDGCVVLLPLFLIYALSSVSFLLFANGQVVAGVRVLTATLAFAVTLAGMVFDKACDRFGRRGRSGRPPTKG